MRSPPLHKTQGSALLITPRGIIEVVSSHGRSSEKRKEGDEVWATRHARLITFGGIIEVVPSRGRSSEKKKQGEEV